MTKENNLEQYVDLHLHSTYSDGSTEIHQIVKDCALMGVQTIAITDHDNYKGYFQAVEEAKKWRINVLTGVEMSAGKYHILGYDFDINNKDFLNMIDKNREKINSKVYQRLEILQKQGIPLTKEKIDNYFPDSMLNKVHVSMAMFLDPECEEFVKGKSSNTVYEEFLGRDKPASQIKKVKLITPKKYIQEVKKAGGKSIIAHPFLEVKDFKELDELRSYGLNGIEIQPNFKDEINKPFLEYAKKHNMIITYGSDYHGARYLKTPLLGREHNNKIIPFWKDKKELSKEDLDNLEK